MKTQNEILDRCRNLMVGEAYDIGLDNFQEEFSSTAEFRALVGPFWQYSVDGPTEDCRWITVAKVRAKEPVVGAIEQAYRACLATRS